MRPRRQSLRLIPTTGVRCDPSPRMFPPAKWLLGSGVAHWRPFARSGLGAARSLTLRWLVSAAAILALFSGLAYWEHTRIAVWSVWIKQPAHTFVEISSVTARLFQYALVLVLLPLGRNTNGIVPYLLGSSFEYLIAVHRMAGDLAIFLGVTHVAATFIFKALNKESIAEMCKAKPNIFGLVALGAFVALRLMALKALRKHMGHFWFHVLHGAMSTISLIALSWHYSVRKMWLLAAVPLVIWAVDAVWRMWKVAAGRASILNRKYLRRSRAVVIDLDMPDFPFSPGQWATICFPAVSRTEYHPVSLMASSISDAMIGVSIQSSQGGLQGQVRLRVLVRDHGDWSKAVVAMPFDKLVAGGAIVQGPFGRLMLPVYDCPYLVILGGGSGISSAIGTLQAVLYERTRGDTLGSGSTHKPIKIWMLLSTQDRDIYAPFEDDIAAMAGFSNVTIKCYETGPFNKPYTIESRPTPDGEDVHIPVDVGLPDLNEFMTGVAKEASRLKVRRVGVVSVGPPPMQESVIQLCAEKNKEYDGVFTVALKPHSWFNW